MRPRAAARRWQKEQRIELDGLTIEIVRADERVDGSPADERLELRTEPTGGTGAAGADTAPRIVAIGWATVEIHRLAAELGREAAARPDDPLLGARTALIAGDPPLLLLEPATEGRLAASLARFGEGPVALYVTAAESQRGMSRVQADLRARGLNVTPVVRGPFGPEVAVVGGPARGPHLVFCGADEQGPGPGTID